MSKSFSRECFSVLNLGQPLEYFWPVAGKSQDQVQGLWLVRFEPWSTLFLILCDFPAMAHNQKITNILEKKWPISTTWANMIIGRSAMAHNQ